MQKARLFFLHFESALRTLSPPDSDSWLASRLFIDEEAVPELKPCGDLPPANDSEAKEGNPRRYRGACTIRTNRRWLNPYAGERGGGASCPRWQPGTHFCGR